MHDACCLHDQHAVQYTMIIDGLQDISALKNLFICKRHSEAFG